MDAETNFRHIDKASLLEAHRQKLNELRAIARDAISDASAEDDHRLCSSIAQARDTFCSAVFKVVNQFFPSGVHSERDVKSFQDRVKVLGRAAAERVKDEPKTKRLFQAIRKYHDGVGTLLLQKAGVLAVKQKAEKTTGQTTEAPELEQDETPASESVVHETPSAVVTETEITVRETLPEREEGIAEPEPSDLAAVCQTPSPEPQRPDTAAESARENSAASFLEELNRIGDECVKKHGLHDLQGRVLAKLSDFKKNDLEQNNNAQNNYILSLKENMLSGEVTRNTLENYIAAERKSHERWLARLATIVSSSSFAECRTIHDAAYLDFFEQIRNSTLLASEDAASDEALRSPEEDNPGIFKDDIHYLFSHEQFRCVQHMRGRGQWQHAVRNKPIKLKKANAQDVINKMTKIANQLSTDGMKTLWTEEYPEKLSASDVRRLMAKMRDIVSSGTKKGALVVALSNAEREAIANEFNRLIAVVETQLLEKLGVPQQVSSSEKKGPAETPTKDSPAAPAENAPTGKARILEPPLRWAYGIVVENPTADVPGETFFVDHSIDNGNLFQISDTMDEPRLGGNEVQREAERLRDKARQQLAQLADESIRIANQRADAERQEAALQARQIDLDERERRLQESEETVMQSREHLADAINSAAEDRQKLDNDIAAHTERENMLAAREEALTESEKLLREEADAIEKEKDALLSQRSDFDLRVLSLDEREKNMETQREKLERETLGLTSLADELQAREGLLAEREQALERGVQDLARRQAEIHETADQDLTERERALAEKNQEFERRLQDSQREIDRQKQSIADARALADEVQSEALRQMTDARKNRSEADAALREAQVLRTQAANLKRENEELRDRSRRNMEEAEAAAQIAQEQMMLAESRQHAANVKEEVVAERERAVLLREKEAQAEMDSSIARATVLTQREAELEAFSNRLQANERALESVGDLEKRTRELEQREQDLQRRMQEFEDHRKAELERLEAERLQLADDQAALEGEREEVEDARQELEDIDIPLKENVQPSMPVAAIQPAPQPHVGSSVKLRSAANEESVKKADTPSGQKKLKENPKIRQLQQSIMSQVNAMTLCREISADALSALEVAFPRRAQSADDKVLESALKKTKVKHSSVAVIEKIREFLQMLAKRNELLTELDALCPPPKGPSSPESPFLPFSSTVRSDVSAEVQGTFYTDDDLAALLREKFKCAKGL